MNAAIAIQEIVMVWPKSADAVQAGNFGPIRTFAEDAVPEQKPRPTPDLLAGRKVISLGMSKPDAGSAVTELATSARDGDDFIISDAKTDKEAKPRVDRRCLCPQPIGEAGWGARIRT